MSTHVADDDAVEFAETIADESREGFLNDLQDPLSGGAEEQHPERVPLAEFQNTTRIVSRDVNLYVYRVVDGKIAGMAVKDPLHPPLKVKDFLRLGDGVYKVDIRHPATGKPVHPNRIFVRVHDGQVEQVDRIPTPDPEPQGAPTIPSMPTVPDGVVILPADLMEKFLGFLQHPPVPTQATPTPPEYLSAFVQSFQQTMALQAEVQKTMMDSMRLQLDHLRRQMQALQPPEEESGGSEDFLSFLRALLSGFQADGDEDEGGLPLEQILPRLKRVLTDEFGEDVAEKIASPEFLQKVLQQSDD